nr:cyclodeaminase/cyclohydrolase family protein [uncultured Aminipila sp.]
MDFVKGSCEDFVTVLASKAPIPGGGGASALVGAIGAALGNMVASLTVGKKKYADVEEQMCLLKDKTENLQRELLELVGRDAEVFEPLSKAYGMPKNTEDEIAEKDKVMEHALKEACSVPLEIMKKCCEAIELHKEYAEKGSALAVSDAGVGVVFCKAALQGASLNVFINTKAMKDKQYADKINIEAKTLLTKYEKMADEIYRDVLAKLVKE